MINIQPVILSMVQSTDLFTRKAREQSYYELLGTDINPPMVKPFRQTYLAKGDGGDPNLEILTIVSMTFLRIVD